MRMLLQRKFAAVNDIPEIGFSRRSEQYKKFIPHILFGSDGNEVCNLTHLYLQFPPRNIFLYIPQMGI